MPKPPDRSSGDPSEPETSSLTEAVVAAARRGDQEAFRHIYLALAPEVVRYLRAKGVVDAESLAGDVFVAVLRRLDRVDGGAAGLRRFVFSVAHRRLVDHHRARARGPAVVPYRPEDDARSVPSAEEAAAARRATERVLAVLDQLPVDQRDVLLLRVVGDLSVDDVATIMARSPGAVKQLQRRALTALRAILAERGAPR